MLNRIRPMISISAVDSFSRERPSAWHPGNVTVGMGLLVLLLVRPAFGNETHREARVRRPVSLAVVGERLYAANQYGSLSVIDPHARKVTAEFDVAERLAWITAIPETQTLLAVDETGHQLLVMNVTGDSVRVAHRVPVSPYPVHVVYSPKSSRCFVTSLWSRRLTILDLKPAPHVVSQVDLPFAPRCQVLSPDETRLIVGDAFGGNLMVVAADTGKLLQLRPFPAHNIRGLAISEDGQTLIVAHQMLNEFATTVQNDVHWGLLMSNDLRWLSLPAVLDPARNVLDESHMHPLGQPNHGSGDPSGVVVAPDATVIVTVAAVNEVAFGRDDDFSFLRRKVGRRPTAVVTSADSRFAYIANTFSDSVSILDLVAREVVYEVVLGPQPELTAIQEGELLFYDGQLALDGWMTCHSCHTDGHTNAQLNDNFSDASFGAPKSVLSLLGAHDTAPYAWNGRAPSLEAQITKSITVTMQKRQPPHQTQVAKLASFVNSLTLPPSIDEARRTADAGSIERGLRVFKTLQCNNCHIPPTYTSPETYDVGMTDQEGNHQFNPPSLRGVGQRRVFFHDNRAVSLRDVLVKLQHPQEQTLSPAELTDLLSFLRSL